MASLKDVKGIGPKSLMLLNKININDVEDLVTHYPFRYDVLKRDELSKVEDGEKIIIDGKIFVFMWYYHLQLTLLMK